MIIKQTKEMTDSERIAAENSNNQYLRTLTYAPIGMIIPFGGSVIPNAFLLCDGSVLNTTEYADLFNAIGYTYGGSGDTFKIPDFVSTTLNDVSVKFIIKTANGITEKERLEILGNVDQTYNPESENAQSGKAVAAAIEGIEIPSADQTYNPESENAQSGKAVAQAVDGSVPKKKMSALGAPFPSVLAVDNRLIQTENDTTDVPNADSYQYIDAVPSGVWEDVPNYKGTIPIRDDNGNLFTGEPKNDVDCANKAYIDTLIGDIDSALTKLHNYAQALIGGNS